MGGEYELIFEITVPLNQTQYGDFKFLLDYDHLLIDMDANGFCGQTEYHTKYAQIKNIVPIYGQQNGANSAIWGYFCARDGCMVIGNTGAWSSMASTASIKIYGKND